MKIQDRINSIAPREAVRGALAAISALQNELPEVQVMGTAVLFLTICEQAGIHIPTVLNQAARMVNDGDINREASALKDYVRGELK